MRNKKLRLLFAMVSAAMVTTAAPAASIDLAEWGINMDGTITEDSGVPHTTTPGSLPSGVDGTAFDFTTGLGTLTISLTGTGSHFINLFLDHEIDQVTNTFFNELGGTGGGSAASGQSWQIDEPGFRQPNPGTIYDNFVANTLDNTNHSTSPDDVSMALGWNFTLAAGEVGDAVFTVSTQAPTTGFYLSQTDPDSPATIYFQSTLEKQPPCPNCIPEPGTILLTLTGLAGLAGLRQQRKGDC